MSLCWSFSCTHPPYVDISSFSVIPYIHMTRMKRQNEERRTPKQTTITQMPTKTHKKRSFVVWKEATTMDEEMTNFFVCLIKPFLLLIPASKTSVTSRWCHPRNDIQMSLVVGLFRSWWYKPKGGWRPWVSRCKGMTKRWEYHVSVATYKLLKC